MLFLNYIAISDIIVKHNVMNLDILKQPNPSGSFYKELYMIKNYNNEYNYIINYAIMNNLDVLFKEKVYLCLNKLTQTPFCKNKNCTNKTKYKNSTLGYFDYCSNKCISSDVSIKKLKELNSIKKYGTKSPTQNNLVKNKTKETNNLLYGGNSPMSSKSIQEKSKITLKNNYGVINPAKSDILLNKRIESFKKSSFKETYKETSIKKYGVTHPWANTKIHNKTIDFFYVNYVNRIKEKITKIKNIIFIKMIYKPTALIFNCENCKNEFNINSSQFYYRADKTPNQICTNCYPISENSSLMQIDLLNFIKENYKGNILENKKILKTHEIDIFLPELNLGIEFNGIYWHSDKFKDRNYHLDKWNKSIENNVKLITIWEDDWCFRNDICKSFILNKLNKTKNNYYARKCIIKEVSYNESKLFLDNNHLQGNSISSVRIGLYFNNELVSLMTFGKMRLPLSGVNMSNEYELIRFANTINSNCVGGASKLLSFFIKTYNPIKIISYSDNQISYGNMYEKIGFVLSHISQPGYTYVINDKREHRFNWRKDKLVKLGYDENKTEFEIMFELGYNKCYNAGNKKWILNL